MNGYCFIVLINDFCKFFYNCFSRDFFVFKVEIVMCEIIGGKIVCVVNKFVFYYVIVFV